ncbi:DUF3375 family protein [Paeniglutamicibacter sp.]|uniref:DUF3375 family protein n=1 Tax=Paeniglutamicibacter sp. TaxID=1934391 RepID=UPI00398918AF
MADIGLELSRVQSAFDRPTLGLLSKNEAPLVVAIFRSTFSRDVTQMTATTFHAHVETLLGILASNGHDGYEPSQARQLCRDWVRRKWLILDARDDGEEFYALTSHAQDAMAFVQNLGGERALLSESRIRTIVDVARRSAMDANPDADARLQLLNKEISRLTTERDRISKGGHIEAASDDRMLEAFMNLADLLDDLPSDFKRVEESVAKMHRQIISAFRTDGRPKGDIVGEYLTRSRNVLNDSTEGRAYQGALDLLARDEMLASLRQDIEALLAHPFAQALTRSDRDRVTALAALLIRGVETIQDQQRHLSATLRTNLAQKEALRSKELDTLLHELRQQLAQRIERSGVRTRVNVSLTPSKFEVSTLRERLHDPAELAPPPPLDDTGQDGVALTAEEIRQQGGPSFSRLRSMLLNGLSNDDTQTAADVFNRLAATDRRPVEVLGLLHVAGASLLRSDAEEIFETVRSDGTHVAYAAPLLTFTDEELRFLARDEETS